MSAPGSTWARPMASGMPSGEAILDRSEIWLGPIFEWAVRDGIRARVIGSERRRA